MEKQKYNKKVISLFLKLKEIFERSRTSREKIELHHIPVTLCYGRARSAIHSACKVNCAMRFSRSGPESTPEKCRRIPEPTNQPFSSRAVLLTVITRPGSLGAETKGKKKKKKERRNEAPTYHTLRCFCSVPCVIGAESAAASWGGINRRKREKNTRGKREEEKRDRGGREERGERERTRAASTLYHRGEIFGGLQNSSSASSVDVSLLPRCSGDDTCTPRASYSTRFHLVVAFSSSSVLLQFYIYSKPKEQYRRIMYGDAYALPSLWSRVVHIFGCTQQNCVIVVAVVVDIAPIQCDVPLPREMIIAKSTHSFREHVISRELTSCA